MTTAMLIPRGEAVISTCELFRGWLTRPLGGDVPLVSIGVNPSTADHIEDDQTITKDQGYAQRWNLGMVVKVNMYGYRATFPKDMWAAQARGEDIVGVDIRGLHNDDYILRAIQLAIDRGGKVLAAWGKIPKRDRVAEVLRKIRERFGEWYEREGLLCLGSNLDGSPKHNCYLSYSIPPTRWEAGAWAA